MRCEDGVERCDELPAGFMHSYTSYSAEGPRSVIYFSVGRSSEFLRQPRPVRDEAIFVQMVEDYCLFFFFPVCNLAESKTNVQNMSSRDQVIFHVFGTSSMCEKIMKTWKVISAVMIWLRDVSYGMFSLFFTRKIGRKLDSLGPNLGRTEANVIWRAVGVLEFEVLVYLEHAPELHLSSSYEQPISRLFTHGAAPSQRSIIIAAPASFLWTPWEIAEKFFDVFEYRTSRSHFYSGRKKSVLLLV